MTLIEQERGVNSCPYSLGRFSGTLQRELRSIDYIVRIRYEYNLIFLKIFLMWTFFLNKFIYLFICLFFGCIGSSLLCAGFLQLRRVGVTLRCGARASHCSGFSCCGAQALGERASVVVVCGLNSCGSWALEHKLRSFSARASLLCSMWDLPRPGLEPVSPALAGGFLTTVLPGKPQCGQFLKSLLKLLQYCFCFMIFFWPQGMWDLSSPTRDRTHNPCIGRAES